MIAHGAITGARGTSRGARTAKSAGRGGTAIVCTSGARPSVIACLIARGVAGADHARVGITWRGAGFIGRRARAG